MLKAIAKGTLRFGSIEADCYILEDGSRHLSGRQIAPLVGAANDGRLNRSLARLPSRFAHLALQPTTLCTLPDGGVAECREASFLPELCKAYSEMADTGELHHKQRHIARAAGEILRALATVGIYAMIDEATGRKPTSYVGVFEGELQKANDRIQAQALELGEVRAQLTASTSVLVEMTKVLDRMQALIVYRPTGAVTKDEASIVKSHVTAIATVRNRTWGLKPKSAWLRVDKEVRRRADWSMDPGSSWDNLPHSRYGEVCRILKQMVAEDAAISKAIRKALDAKESDPRQIALKLN